MLFATVRQRKIYVKAPQTVVKDGVNVDVLRLEMDDEWAEMTSIICVFSNGSVKKEVMHTFGQPITVPWECLESTGVLMLGITGYVGTQKVMTTMNADNGWEIVQNSETTGEEQFEATPTLTQQLLEAATSANSAAEAANTAKQDILDAVNNGEFDGAPGAAGKSAYQYAQDGGYTGTEEEFTGKMAAEIPSIDNTLTKSGQAADAAVVGDRLSALSEDIVELDTTMTQSGKAADAKAVGDALAGKVDGIGITAIMAITQEDYDELVMMGEVSATTLYIITANAGGGGAEVTMVPYLVSDGVAYIDTGYKCTAEDVLELTYRDIGKPDDGTYITAGTPYCGGNVFIIGYAGGRYVQATHAGAYLGYKLTDLNAKATIKRDPTTLYYNGELVGTATAGTKAETMSTLIFAQKLSDTSVKKCAHKVYFYGLKIWQGDSLVHYYKPAQDESGVACVYDEVTKEYFYNAGTEGALTYGEEVEGS